MIFHYNDVIMSAMASQITSLTIVYSIVYSGADQRKHQSSTSLAFVSGIHCFFRQVVTVVVTELLVNILNRGINLGISHAFLCNIQRNVKPRSCSRSGQVIWNYCCHYRDYIECYRNKMNPQAVKKLTGCRPRYLYLTRMTSSNGSIFHVTGPLCGNSPVTGEFPAQRPVTQGFDVPFDLRRNKRLSKQSWHRWFETTSRSLWRHCIGCLCNGCNVIYACYVIQKLWWSVDTELVEKKTVVLLKHCRARYCTWLEVWTSD